MKKGKKGIEKKARDFAGYNIPSSQDIVTTAKMNGRYEGFKADAEWMHKKAIDFGRYRYSNWGGFAEEKVQLIKKSMESMLLANIIAKM